MFPRACRGADPDGTTLYVGLTEISLKYSTPEWTAGAGTAADGFDLRKTTVTNSWDAGMFDSRHPITGTGYVQVRADTTSGHRIFGLSDWDGGVTHLSIWYGIFLRLGGQLWVIENGILITPTLTTYSVGDQIRV